MPPGVDENQTDENRMDFELLTRHLKFPSAATSKSSTSNGRSDSPNSISSNSSTNNSSDMIWPLHLTPTFISHYVTGEIIGNGSYAEVRECVDMITLERLALKITNKSYLVKQAPQALANQRQEIRLLRNLKHAHIISMKECLETDNHIYIVLEYCPLNLDELICDQADSRLSIPVARRLFRQLCSAVGYLHSVGIVHRDIKPRNMLMTNCGCLKLIDFGVSHILPIWNQTDTCSNYEGTPLFQAPEIVAGGSTYRGFKADVWSCGVSLFRLLYGSYPFDDEGLLGLYDKILGEELSIPVGEPTSFALTDLLVFMLDRDCSRRASIEQVIEHPWMKLSDGLDDINDNEFTEFFNLLAKKSNDRTKSIDMYKSMTVLPYLYKHHFPNLPIKKSRPRESDGSKSKIIITKINSLESSVEPSNLDDRKSSRSSNSSLSTSSPPPITSDRPSTNDDHDDQPIEWGTKEQYHLMKVPQVRANRTRCDVATKSRSRERVKKSSHRKHL